MTELCAIVSNLLQITEQMSYPRCRLGGWGGAVGEVAGTFGGCWELDVQGDYAIEMQEGESRTPRGWTDTISRADVFFLITSVVSCHGTNGSA